MEQDKRIWTTEDVWTTFKSLPIAALEDYGITCRTVALLEQRYGIYIGGMQAATREDLLRIPQVAKKEAGKIQDALRLLLQEVERTLCGSKTIRTVTVASIRISPSAGQGGGCLRGNDAAVGEQLRLQEPAES